MATVRKHTGFLIIIAIMLFSGCASMEPKPVSNFDFTKPVGWSEANLEELEGPFSGYIKKTVRTLNASSNKPSKTLVITKTCEQKHDAVILIVMYSHGGFWEGGHYIESSNISSIYINHARDVIEKLESQNAECEMDTNRDYCDVFYVCERGKIVEAAAHKAVFDSIDEPDSMIFTNFMITTYKANLENNRLVYDFENLVKSFSWAP